TPVVLPGTTQRQRIMIACYGLAAAIWRIIVYLSLSIITLAILPIEESHMIWYILLLLVGFAIWRLTGKKRFPTPKEKTTPARRIIISTVGVGLIGLILLGFSTPFRLTAPAIVEYAPLQVIRNHSPGFVKRIDVFSGQSVNPGQVIGQLSNDELSYELADLVRQINISKLTLRGLQRDGDMAAFKAEKQKLSALQKRLDEKQEQVEELVIRAPIAGIIITRHPETLVGKYLAEGSEVVAIGDELLKELRVSVEQDDSDAFFAQISKPVWIRVGNIVFSNTLSQIEPRASVEPIHPALMAAMGGSLLVQRKPKSVDGKKDGSGKETYELLTPQFNGEVKLSLNQSVLLAAGQRAQVSFTPQGQSIGDFLFNRFQRWCRDKIRRMRSAWNLS
ncbi:MAG: efflux RND transporter periplasmic adaptor subunit, partial [Thermoguttaceae bacterium]